MRHLSFRFAVVLGFTFFFLGGCNIIGSSGQENSSKLVSKEPIEFSIQDLNYVKEQLNKEDNRFQDAFDKILIEANKALNSYGYSVVTKEGSAPNGDKHEYVSRGRYWWPNPDTKDGLPYVKRDGKTNPEIYQFDRISLSNLRSDIKKLSVAYHLTEDEKFAQKAISLIKQWFIDSETKMNPNLRFAQGIPGKTTGRPAGIIEGVDFTRILNYIPILQSSQHWTNDIDLKLTLWYNKLYKWLLEHKYGMGEKNAKNNHGTWYDVQIATYAYFLDNHKKLEKVLNRVKTKRIPEQIATDGKQPYEINRTRSFHYSVYNLDAFTILANFTDRTQKVPPNISDYSNELWSYSISESGSIQDAVQFLVPFFNNKRVWTYEQVGNFNPCSALPVLKRAYDQFGKDNYRESYHAITTNNPKCRESIDYMLFPIEEK